MYDNKFGFLNFFLLAYGHQGYCDGSICFVQDGVYRITSIEALQVVTGDISLGMPREQLVDAYYV